MHEPPDPDTVDRIAATGETPDSDTVIRVAEAAETPDSDTVIRVAEAGEPPDPDTAIPVAEAGEPPDPDTVIRLAEAGKRFDDTWVLRDLEFAVRTGTIVGLIGPSGCGKTTTVRMITGTYEPDAGTISTLGVDPVRLGLGDRQRIGYLPQLPVLFDSLTLWENLNFHASLNGVRLRRRARLHEVLELVELGEHRAKKVSEASGGMRRRLALAATLVHRPDLLVLDEPTAGIDPILRNRFWEHFRGLASSGVTVVITTQYVGEAANCETVGLLSDGRLIHYASPESLRRSALGGELLRIRTDRPVDESFVEELSRRVEGFKAAEREDPTTLSIVVDDAGASTHAVLQLLDERGLAAVDSEEVVLDYEEMFVRLVEADRASSEDEATRRAEAGL